MSFSGNINMMKQAAGAPSKDIAKQRLKNVLDAERNGVPKKSMDMMRADLEQVIGSYFDISTDKLSVKIERKRSRDGITEQVLMLTAVIGGAKRTGMKI